MDPKELRRLCELVLNSFRGEAVLPIFSDDIARSCLRLLDDNDAMRGCLEVIAEYRTPDRHKNATPSAVDCMSDLAIVTLDKLGERK